MSRVREGLVQRFGVGEGRLIQPNLWKSHPGGGTRPSRLSREGRRVFRRGAGCGSLGGPARARWSRRAGRAAGAIPCGVGFAGRGERFHPPIVTPPGRAGIKSLGGGARMSREGSECPALSRDYRSRESPSRSSSPERSEGDAASRSEVGGAAPDIQEMARSAPRRQSPAPPLRPGSAGPPPRARGGWVPFDLMQASLPDDPGWSRVALRAIASGDAKRP